MMCCCVREMFPVIRCLAMGGLASVFLVGCVRSPTAETADAPLRMAPRGGERPRPAFRIVASHEVDDLGRSIAQFETVFWEPRDTESLRAWLRDSTRVRDQTVLEIGTGTGLLALCCLRAGARKVVATDVNPAAVANVRHNAEVLGVNDRLEARQVPLNATGAFSVVGPNERFDLIISNPPWENRRPETIGEYALYDERFALLESLLQGFPNHLQPDGVVLLAYGSVDAIQKTVKLSQQLGHEARILDDRSLAELPAVFLPGMLLEVRRKPE